MSSTKNVRSEVYLIIPSLSNKNIPSHPGAFFTHLPAGYREASVEFWGPRTGFGKLCGSWARSACPTPVINWVLLHSHVYFFMYCLWLLSSYNGWVVEREMYNQQSLKYSLSGPKQKKKKTKKKNSSNCPKMMEIEDRRSLYPWTTTWVEPPDPITLHWTIL